MYADKITDSMQQTIEETNRRREKQLKYNSDHGITPAALTKSKADIMSQSSVVSKVRGEKEKYYVDKETTDIAADPVVAYMSKEQLMKLKSETVKRMEKAARELDFMEAARLRDEMIELDKLISSKD